MLVESALDILVSLFTVVERVMNYIYRISKKKGTRVARKSAFPVFIHRHPYQFTT